MSRMCTLCGRGANTANSRSKSNIATKRTQKVNLQKFLVNAKTQLVCTRCIRTKHKTKA